MRSISRRKSRSRSSLSVRRFSTLATRLECTSSRSRDLRYVPGQGRIVPSKAAVSPSLAIPSTASVPEPVEPAKRPVPPAIANVPRGWISPCRVRRVGERVVVDDEHVAVRGGDPALADHVHLRRTRDRVEHERDALALRPRPVADVRAGRRAGRDHAEAARLHADERGGERGRDAEPRAGAVIGGRHGRRPGPRERRRQHDGRREPPKPCCVHVSSFRCPSRRRIYEAAGARSTVYVSPA